MSPTVWRVFDEDLKKYLNGQHLDIDRALRQASHVIRGGLYKPTRFSIHETNYLEGEVTVITPVASTFEVDIL